MLVAILVWQLSPSSPDRNQDSTQSQTDPVARFYGSEIALADLEEQLASRSKEESLALILSDSFYSILADRFAISRSDEDIESYASEMSPGILSEASFLESKRYYEVLAEALTAVLDDGLSIETAYSEIVQPSGIEIQMSVLESTVQLDETMDWDVVFEKEAAKTYSEYRSGILEAGRPTYIQTRLQARICEIEEVKENICEILADNNPSSPSQSCSDLQEPPRTYEAAQICRIESANWLRAEFLDNIEVYDLSFESYQDHIPFLED